MSAPDRHPVILQPPHPNMSPQDRDFYEKTIYERTGGLEANVVNLKGLEASVNELNTLVGISVDTTVQKQLNEKANLSSLGTLASQDSDSVSITGGSITDTDIESDEIKIRAGTTSSFLHVGGTLNADMTPKGNNAGVETDLISYTIPGNTLSQPNMYLNVTAFGTIAANANLKEIKLILGSTTLLTTGSIASNNGSWRINAKIIRVSAASEKCITTILSDNALIVDSANYVSAAETLTTGLIIKCTGNGVALNDVVQEGLILEWHRF